MGCAGLVWRRLLGLSLLVLLVAPLPASDFLPPEQAFRMQVLQRDAARGQLQLRFDIAAGYYLYRDQFAARSVDGGRAQIRGLPAGELVEDLTFGLTEVLRDSVQLTVHSRDSTRIELRWQGCAEAGLCYQPQQQTIDLSVTDRPAGGGLSALWSDPVGLSLTATAGGGLPVQVPAAADEPLEQAQSVSLASVSQANDSQIVSWLTSRSLWLSLPAFFLLGVALTFTPCVLPMIPILSSMLLGRSVSTRQGLILSGAFVLPMALTYALLGAVAALLGGQLQAALQNIWVIGAFGLVFLLLALAMFGLYTLQLPEFLRRRLDALGRDTCGGTLFGAAAMGTLSALLVGPCMTAPLAGVLLYVAQTGNVSSGTGLLFSMGLGMGVPLLIIGTLGPRWLPRPGPWMDIVRGGFGFALLATGIWMLSRVLPPPVILALWGVLLVALGLSLAYLASQRQPAAMLLLRTLGVVLGVWGAAQLLGAAAGGHEPLRPLAGMAQMRSAAAAPGEGALAFEPVSDLRQLQQHLQQARRQGQPVMVDVTADWCVYCKVIARDVYTAPAVLRSTADALLLQVDLTRGGAAQRELLRQFQVLGPPTVMLFDPRGEEQRQARLVGAFGERQLLDSLTQVSYAKGGPR